MTRSAVFGSGIVPPPVVASQPDTTFVSIVTAPLRARALPHGMFAPVFNVILVSARIFPAKLVWVPRVAELPTS
jgi:hypothetical protein